MIQDFQEWTQTAYSLQLLLIDFCNNNYIITQEHDYLTILGLYETTYFICAGGFKKPN